MIKEAETEKRFDTISPWMGEVIKDIKKDLKKEHLRQDLKFVQKYFSRKFVDKLTGEELLAAYSQELKEGNQELGDWITTRWVMKHTDIYQYFAHFLTQINPQFDEIEEIPEDKANLLIQGAVAQFGAKDTYIFSVLNAVAFSKNAYEGLRAEALRG